MGYFKYGGMELVNGKGSIVFDGGGVTFSVNNYD